MADTKIETKLFWEELAATKRQTLASSIPEEWAIPPHMLPAESVLDVATWPATSGWFTPDELAITSRSAGDLLSMLASGQLTSEAVTRAFCKRAAAAHQLTNCLSETCFDRAIASAKARDDALAQTGKPIGPLHGLPISLKDSFNLRGVDSVVGISAYIGDPAQSDATLVQLLEKAGAVFYVKTSVPTAMLIGETVNNVLGRTVNPLNRKTTSGGSSGGESSLIAMKGSPLGIGTDIAGSLRMPAACTGLFTLRPSFGRFPSRNCRSSLPGQEALLAVNGPIASTLADVELYSKIVVDAQPWLQDPKCLPIPWRPVEVPAKLRIAVMWHDGHVRPTPPVTRALREITSKLKLAGHEVIDWDTVEQKHGLSLLMRMIVADGGKIIDKLLEKTGEPWRAELWYHRAAAELSTSEMWQLQAERSMFQTRYLDLWNEAGIDAILCPTMAFNTVENGKFRHLGYTGVFNVLDYPAVSFPTGLAVDKTVDKPDPAYIPLGPDCEAINTEYNEHLMHGMPISLQLVARRLEEERLLAMCRRVLEAVG
ncbi:Fatty-acid amide hydrolase [Aspergillus mulundensis]|uniref:amidase n=1 Tax=Aspergillus mulundensis TaxID=1810919 RepID=A0A3D8R8X0_9EURO|nr:Fatty-acid amide hydrolase [Aspergillus mulundensis]RDW70503.1 Fatty-acid amide hydrolase [Aspergillus mulundensis]